MEEHEVVPDVIDRVPKFVAEVAYPNGLKVDLGKELTPIQVKDQPQVTWEADPSKFYTLLMIDPDAPSRQTPTYGDIKHWLVVNIPGADVSKGDEIAEYIGSRPSNGSGLHRYIFLVYQQEKKQNFVEPRSGKYTRAHRISFSTKEFAKKYNLGDPVAGNFDQAQWDPYVEEARKQVTD